MARAGHTTNQVSGDVPGLEAFLEDRRVTTPSSHDLLAYPNLWSQPVMVDWPPNVPLRAGAAPDASTSSVAARMAWTVWTDNRHRRNPKGIIDEMAEPKIPRIRRAPLPDDALIVVRGNDLDPAAARRQADVFRRRFPDWGRWGLSAFYARSDAEIEDLAADQLERFPLLGCYRVADLQAAGFEIWLTFRTPHVTIAFSGDPDEHLAALVRAAHDVRINPYHETDNGPER